MADQKNDTNKTPPQNKGGQGGDASKSVQSATLASHTSKPLGGQVTDHNRGQSATGGQDRGGALDAARDGASGITESARETAGAVKEKASEALEGATEWAEDTYGRVSEWASDAYESRSERLARMRQRSAQSARRVTGGVQEYVSENPMVVGLVALAAGLLIGALLPRTRRENAAFGEWADELRHQGVRYAREATQKGREFVEETFEGEDPRFSKHESEFKPDREGMNRH